MPRSLRYLYLKILHQKESPHEIALGVAIGCFVGFFVPGGGQIITIFLLAFFIKFNKMLAIIFIFVTSNHFSIPVTYPLQIQLGSYITGISTGESYKILIDSILSFEFSGFGKSTLELLLNFLVGGVITGGISAVLSYYLTLRIIRRHRKKRKESRENKNDLLQPERKNMAHKVNSQKAIF